MTAAFRAACAVMVRAAAPTAGVGRLGSVCAFIVCSVATASTASAKPPSAACDIVRAEWTGNIGPAIAVFDMDVAFDGSAFLAGHFGDTTDLDPTDGLDERTAQGTEVDAFITKTLADGTYAWSYTAGGTGWDDAAGVTVASTATVLIAGSFSGTVDFNPTEGVDEHTAIGNYNAFVTKLSTDGAYLSTFTLGGGRQRRRVQA